MSFSKEFIKTKPHILTNEDVSKKWGCAWKCLSLIIIFCSLIVLGCSTTYHPEYLKISAVSTTSVMGIDGTWRFPSGDSISIKRGNIYVEDNTQLPKGAVIGTNLRKSESDEYELYWLSWDNKKRISSYGPAIIRILKYGEMRLHTLSNSVTDTNDDYYTLTSLSLDKPYIHLTDWERLNGDKIDPSELINTYKIFLNRYPDSFHTDIALSRLNRLKKAEWEKAEKKDKVYEYEKFLKNYPDSRYAFLARLRMTWQKENRAIVKIEEPEVVEAESRNLINTTTGVARKGDFYEWKTIFKEVGGKTGFKVNKEKGHYDCGYATWDSGLFGTWYMVPPNGEKIYESGHTKACPNGIYKTTWRIEDDWGNKSTIVKTIRLK
jgi:hypothetical protein